MKDIVMENIKIYKKEVKDGLQEVISNNKISFASQITQLIIEPEPTNIFQSIAAEIRNQPDLVHRYSILASVGWNGNDDVFLAEELFNARETPVDKQVNFMHDELTIIGHMTEAFVLNGGGELIKTTKFDELPKNFDIGVGFVIYKMWEDKTRADLVNKVISEIDSGNWFVSMECMFPDFDYAVLDDSGNQYVVTRSEQTSFLSKYLRIYGGNGVYQNYKIGRLLRNLFFSGKGIVENPANKRSVILHTNFSSKASNLKLREIKMDELEKIKLELAKAQTRNEELVKELSEKTKAAVSKEIEIAKAEKDAAIADLAKAKEALEKSEANVKNALDEAKASKEKADKFEKEIADIKAQAVKSERIAKLVKAGLEETKANEVYTKWAGASEEQFADIVALHTKANDAMCEEEDEKEDKTKADLSKTEAEKKAPGNTKVDINDETAKANFDKLVKGLASLMPYASKLNSEENK